LNLVIRDLRHCIATLLDTCCVRVSSVVPDLTHDSCYCVSSVNTTVVANCATHYSCYTTQNYATQHNTTLHNTTHYSCYTTHTTQHITAVTQHYTTQHITAVTQHTQHNITHYSCYRTHTTQHYTTQHNTFQLLHNSKLIALSCLFPCHYTY